MKYKGKIQDPQDLVTKQWVEDHEGLMARNFVTQKKVGFLDEGTQINSTDKIADILYQILFNTGPSQDITIYYGALDESIPTETSYLSLTKIEGLDSEELVDEGKELTIISHYIESLDVGQVPVIAVTDTLKVSAWKNAATGWSYGDYTTKNMNGFNYYYFTNRVDNEPDGELYAFSFVEAEEE